MKAPRPLHLVDVTAGSPADAVEVPIARSYPLTEAGAAERFADLHADDLKYDHRRSRWLLYPGHRWMPDTDEKIVRLGLAFSRDYQRDALNIGDPDIRKRTFNAAIKLETRSYLTSMLQLAAALAPLADAGDRWDADPAAPRPQEHQPNEHIPRWHRD